MVPAPFQGASFLFLERPAVLPPANIYASLRDAQPAPVLREPPYYFSQRSA